MKERTATEHPKAPVYYVECQTDSFVLVAMDIEMNKEGIRWFNTNRQIWMMIERIVYQSSDRFVFERSAKEGGGTYTIVPMTLDIYNSKVKHKLLAGKDFDNEGEMFVAFKNTYKSAW